MYAKRVRFFIAALTVALGTFLVLQTIDAAILSGNVTVTAVPPSISGILVNGGSAITLTANATTPINVTAAIVDANGCGEITPGTTTVLLYRSGVGSSTCMTTPNTLNCYVATGFTATGTCSGGTENTTTTFNLQYYAQATDASSSYSGQTWKSTILFTTPDNTTGTADSAGVTLNTMTAINNNTSSINYGSVGANANTGSTNQVVTIQNVGNSSTSLQTNGTDMVSGGNTIAVGNEHYSTTTFTYGGSEPVLTTSATTIAGVDIPPTLYTGNINVWGQTTALPYGLDDQGFALYNGYLYEVAGGPSTGGITSSVLFAQITGGGTIGSWSQTTALPYTDWFEMSTAYNGYLYTLGGGANGTSNTSTVMFAPINATGSIGAWSQTTAMPAGYIYGFATAYNGYLYVTGGEANLSATSSVFFAPINATGSIGAWSQTTAMPSAIDRHSSVIYNGYLYVIGGSLTGGPNGTSTVIFAPINATGSIGSWTATQALPYPIYAHNSTAYNGYLYTIGGLNAGAVTSTVVFAPINATGSIGSWSRTTAIPFVVHSFSSAIYNGYLYTVGGNSGGSTSTTVSSQLGVAPQSTYWGLGVPAASPTGTYNGTTTFTAAFSN